MTKFSKLIRPSTWGKYYSIGVEGKRQSPINLCTEKCIKITKNYQKSLVYKYPQNITGLEVANTGHGWKIQLPRIIAERTILKHGPLEHRYMLEQFHGHWGKDCSVGSEHTVNGKSYAAELHFVHWNTDLFSSFAEAVDRDKGLVVIGVLLDVGDQSHQELEKITSRMSSIRYKHQKIEIKDKINIDAFFPQEKSYYTYKGSLTTPPLYESVTWLVLDTPIKVTKEQIDSFRQLSSNTIDESKNEDLCHILENYRPTQPLWGREVKYFE